MIKSIKRLNPLFSGLISLSTTIFILLGVNSCKKDLEAKNIRPLSHSNFSDEIVKKISYEKFSSEFKSIDVAVYNKIFAKPLESSQIFRLTSSIFNEQLTVYIDSIKKIRINNSTTYTFAIKSVDDHSTAFSNLIIESKLDSTRVYIIDYYPDSAFINRHLMQELNWFTGKVQLNVIDLNQALSVKIQGVKPRLQTCTNQLVVTDVSYTLCQGQNNVKHSYNDGYLCEGFGTPQGA